MGPSRCPWGGCAHSAGQGGCVPQESNGPTDAYAAIAKADRLTQEPESLRKWREEQKQRLQELDAASKVLEQEWRERAKKELEEWNLRQIEQMEKNRVNNRAVGVWWGCPSSTSHSEVPRSEWSCKGLGGSLPEGVEGGGPGHGVGEGGAALRLQPQEQQAEQGRLPHALGAHLPQTDAPGALAQPERRRGRHRGTAPHQLAWMRAACGARGGQQGCSPCREHLLRAGGCRCPPGFPLLKGCVGLFTLIYYRGGSLGGGWGGWAGAPPCQAPVAGTPSPAGAWAQAGCDVGGRSVTSPSVCGSAHEELGCAGLGQGQGLGWAGGPGLGWCVGAGDAEQGKGGASPRDPVLWVPLGASCPLAPA
ncbi:clathrin light chain B isoform X2 [Alligator sinensis]|uniref:Clathrin light chain n=1 Tax=Alligator sinensis TaxID=38654 RepID=A0A3Q0FWF7_ALLSI|nr:clathrin light chain B isoform X1 [Alligator sinensis]XP_025050074.1 clathrin light chain B isoform X2 [Alligator sinensis]